MDDPALTSLVAFAGIALMVAAVLYFVSPRARGRLRRSRTAVLVGFVLVIAVVWFMQNKG